jgi:arginyl-tRNA synthetase
MKPYLSGVVLNALNSIEPNGSFPEIHLEIPKVTAHGDFSTNIAMLVAKSWKIPPRAAAEKIVAAIAKDPDFIEAIEIAGPGFINFRLSKNWLSKRLASIAADNQFGRLDLMKGKKVLVEFVSANPTGPLTVGHGRNAVLGDTIARLYEWLGADVQREYYFNDGGRQMRVLGDSVAARYMELAGRDYPFPEGGYEGEYIRDIAADVRKANGDALDPAANAEIFKSAAKEAMFADIRRTMVRMGVNMDSYFNELTLYQDGSNDRVLERLRDKDFIKEEDGAVWFLTTRLGKEKDTVLVKSTGEPTYRLPDIAYHLNKLDRGYDLCIDIFGADHIATFPDVLSAVEILGYDKKRIDVLIYQFVTLLKDGKPFKMSTRKANFITLDELMDEVGADVTRFFFLMRSPGTHLEFDIDAAKQEGEQNPVFYLQYAHARIRSIVRKAAEVNLFASSAHLNLLTHESEEALTKTLSSFPVAVESAATNGEPHRVITYLNSLAADFHHFYHHSRILGEAPEVASARLCLAETVARTLASGLSILGISAPERM